VRKYFWQAGSSSPEYFSQGSKFYELGTFFLFFFFWASNTTRRKLGLQMGWKTTKEQPTWNNQTIYPIRNKEQSQLNAI
jgi:hypothetical protein